MQIIMNKGESYTENELGQKIQPKETIYSFFRRLINKLKK